MKTIFLLITMVSMQSFAQTYTRIGSTTYGSNGISYTRVGATTYGSNGSSYTQVGNTTYETNPEVPKIETYIPDAMPKSHYDYDSED